VFLIAAIAEESITRFVSQPLLGWLRDMPKVVVIGGGLAGIAAALATADEAESNEVILLEARSRLGGRVSSVKDPESGIELDNCQHACFRVYERFFQMMARAGGYDSIKLQKRTILPFMQVGSGKTAILKDGKMAPPNHMAASLLNFPFLSLKDKIAMRKVVKELASMSEQEMSDLDTQDFKSWLIERGQTERTINRFWGFFVLAALNTNIDEASASLSAFLFQRGLFNDPHAFDVGAFTSHLSDSIHPDLNDVLLEAGVDVRLSTTAKSLVWENGCSGVETSGETLDCDSVVMALPHHLTARLLMKNESSEEVKEVAELADGLEYRSLIGIHALHPEPVLPDDFTFTVCVDEEVIQMLFNKNSEIEAENLPIENGQWISVPVSAADDFLDWEDEDFLAEYTRVVKGTFPDTWNEPQTFKVIKTRKATFAATSGSAKYRVRQNVLAEENIYIAGSWTDTGWPSTMEGAVRSGLIAAAELMNIEWDPETDWKRWPRPPQRLDEDWKTW